MPPRKSTAGSRSSSRGPPASGGKPRSRSLARPALPAEHANQLLAQHKGKPHAVKMQELRVPGENASDPDEVILIARVKVPTPKGTPGHIIKRFDTDAVSATSLYRAAFPGADDAELETEMAWISRGSNGAYGDTRAANEEDGPMNRQLSGTWVPLQHGQRLANEYGLTFWTSELFTFDHPTEGTGGANGVHATPGAIASGDFSPAVQTASPPSSARSPPASRTSKRARVSTTTTSKGGKPNSSASGVNVTQTIVRDDRGGATETTQVSISVPTPARRSSRKAAAAAAQDSSMDDEDEDGEGNENHFVDEQTMAAQIEGAKELVETLKVEGVLTSLGPSAGQGGKKKRGIEDVADAGDGTGRGGTSQGFLGKLWRGRVDRRDRDHATANGIITVNPPPDPIVLGDGTVTPGRRRAIAAAGLALATAGIAAVPYFLSS